MEKHLALLAQQYAACEKSDKSEFQRRARVLQSMWREERGYEKGICKSRNGSRPLGSRLPMPWAQKELTNYLTDNIRTVVKREVQSAKSRG